MDFILEGITVNNIPLKKHFQEAPVPEIRKIIKEEEHKPLVKHSRVRYRTRAERSGRVKIYSKEEIQKIMEPLSKLSLTKFIKQALETWEGGITSSGIYASYKEVDPTVTKKKVFQSVSTLAKRMNLIKIQKGKEKIYSLPISEPSTIEVKEGFLPQTLRVEGKIDVNVNININWR
jgi:hypothetical protein